MGFQSPAQDHIQRRITVNDLVVHNPNATLFIERDEGMLIVDQSAIVKCGDRVALVHEGESLLATTGDQFVITEDGQKIDGDALNDVIVLGKVTYEIMSVWSDDSPI